MKELIYAGKEVENIILKQYPLAKIEDASDDVHAERFEVEIDNVGDEEFWKFAIKEGFINTCFSFGLQMSMGFKDRELVKRLTEYVKTLKGANEDNQ